MKYDFTSIIDRHGWDAIAVDNPEVLLPDVKVREAFRRLDELVFHGQW